MTKSWSSEETQMKTLHQRPQAKTDINKVSILTVNTERERERVRTHKVQWGWVGRKHYMVCNGQWLGIGALKREREREREREGIIWDVLGLYSILLLSYYYHCTSKNPYGAFSPEIVRIIV